MSDQKVDLLPQFGTIASAAGVLIIGPMFFSSSTDSEFLSKVDPFREVLETELLERRDATFVFDGPREESRGNLVIRLSGADEFAFHRLDGAGGTCITWSDSSETLIGLDMSTLVYERVGTLREIQYSFECRSVENLARLDRNGYLAFDSGEVAFDGPSPQDFSESGLKVTWHSGVNDAFVVYRGQEVVAVYIADRGWEGDPFPGRDAVRCRPAPTLELGEPIEPGSLERVDLRGASFTGWDLSGVSFKQSDLRGADFSDCKLERASFHEVRADDATFDRSDLTGSSWEFAFAPGACFVNACLEGADLTDAEFERTNLSGANLRGANLWGVTVGDANWAGVDLSNAVIEEGAFITSTDLSHAIVSGANISDCDFTDSNLEGVDLESASLEDVTMPDGTVYE